MQFTGTILLYRNCLVTKLVSKDFPFLSQKWSHKVTIISMDKVDTLDIIDILFFICRCLPITSSVTERLTNHSIFRHQLVYKYFISGENMIFLSHCASPEKSIPTPYTNSERARGLICKLVAVKNGEGGPAQKNLLWGYGIFWNNTLVFLN